MSLPLVFAVLLVFAILTVAAALILPLHLQQKRLRQHVLLRLANPLTSTRPPSDPPMSLRRSGSAWLEFTESVSIERLRELALSWLNPAPILLAAISLGATAAIWFILGIHPLVAGAVGILFGSALWLGWKRLLRNRRQNAIEDVVPEALEMIVRSLRIGQPIGTAIQGAGRDLRGPLAEEFREAADRISYGQVTTQSLRELAERCDNQSLRFLAAAVAIHSSTGGNLAEVLDRLSAIARGRQQTRRKIRAMTAEAKWSGNFLSAFPLAASMMLLAINPSYFSEISDKPFFTPLMAVVGVLLALNILFMRWLVKVE